MTTGRDDIVGQGWWRWHARRRCEVRRGEGVAGLARPWPSPSRLSLWLTGTTDSGMAFSVSSSRTVVRGRAVGRLCVRLALRLPRVEVFIFDALKTSLPRSPLEKGLSLLFLKQGNPKPRT